MKKKTSKLSWFGTGAFTIIGIVYIMPILIVLINSFKNKVFINKEPFKLPTKQTWVGSYGRVDMGAVMAALILAVIPVVIFYLACQKHIIKGVAAGAVKG